MTYVSSSCRYSWCGRRRFRSGILQWEYIIIMFACTCILWKCDLPECLDPDGGMPFIPLSQDTYNSHSAPVTHCKFSPTAKNIATADTDGVLKYVGPISSYTLKHEYFCSSLQGVGTQQARDPCHYWGEEFPAVAGLGPSVRPPHPHGLWRWSGEDVWCLSSKDSLGGLQWTKVSKVSMQLLECWSAVLLFQEPQQLFNTYMHTHTSPQYTRTPSLTCLGRWFSCKCMLVSSPKLFLGFSNLCAKIWEWVLGWRYKSAMPTVCF